jgi:GNAT superfamily N-acetyltransferase
MGETLPRKREAGEWEFRPLEEGMRRNDFDCGVEALNIYLRAYALQNEEKRISRTFVAVPKGLPHKIEGYYTLSAGQVDFENLPVHHSRRLPKYPVPVARIGRLAVDKSQKGKGLGEMLLMDALTRILRVSEAIAIFAVVVDAKDPPAAKFYLKYGFMELMEGSLRLFLPLKTVKMIG